MFATPSCFAISRRLLRFALILLRGSARNYFQICDASQPRQDLLLNAVREIGVIWIGAEVFKRQNGDSVCYWMADKFAFPNDSSRMTAARAIKRRCQKRAGWIAPHPFSATSEESTCAAPGLARALASVPGLRPARERTSNGALDLSPDTSDKSWKDRDLFSDLTGAVAAARCPSSSLIVS